MQNQEKNRSLRQRRVLLLAAVALSLYGATGRTADQFTSSHYWAPRLGDTKNTWMDRSRYYDQEKRVNDFMGSNRVRSSNDRQRRVPSDTGLIVGNLDNKQRLDVGDTIIFRVVEDQEDPRILVVSDSGDINVPELGLVPARGKTCEELAAEVKKNLENTSYHKATVLVGVDQLNPTPSGRKVYVMGEVNRAGPLSVPAGENWTVSRAIAAAGGFTDFANTTGVRVIRREEQSSQSKVFTVNVKELWKSGKNAQDIAITPEDLIYVPMRLF